MSSQVSHKESAFETAIETHLLGCGYIKRELDAYSRELAIDIACFFEFLKASQPNQWEKLESIHGDSTEPKLLQRLVKELDNRGMLDVLRHGITDHGVKFQTVYFKPASGMNPESQVLYDQNIMTITRQVKYSKSNENSLDMVLGINGLPVATVELKNQLSGQNVEHAKNQYKYDRDPRELMFQFKKRALVHFAVDTNEVYMATKLAGKDTYFLPFNKGENNGAGNPDNPSGYKTAYLWEEVWQKDSWLDIIRRFLHLEVTEKKVNGKLIRKETMIFPRYHQLDAVRNLETDVKAFRTGKNYLIQHSAGSGKSNSIAWLAYGLAGLYDRNDDKVFNSVVVITDRLILDSQLQNTIYQFEHKAGMVQPIDKHSTQLAEALSKGVPIIITTLQKFPFVIEKVDELASRNYAVIVDEAHSSQTGDTATALKEVLSPKDLDDAAQQDSEDEGKEDYEDVIAGKMAARGRKDNLSFFAFTATPKFKTLEQFGIKDSPDPKTKPRPFHLYSMRQAIEEGFILDVLKKYTTYKTYLKLTKTIEDDPELDKKKAAKAIARFASLHPHNIAQKSEIMIEHFRQFTRHKIGGQAKAMVVTASRLHAVRYKQAFDTYIKEQRYDDIKALVAFSGTVRDDKIPGIEYTEPSMNHPVKSSEIAEKFGTSDYQVLLVAEKFQTGFDQPLLHTMYVDKRLSGVQAVQTLSRLNRMNPGKDDTFVLDFVNEREEIQEAFQDYYELATIDEPVDPNKLYDLKHELEEFQLYTLAEVEDFCRVFFKPKKLQTDRDQGLLNARLDPAVNRYTELEDAQKNLFKSKLQSYTRLYSFMAQLISFRDSDLEKLYAYGRFLLKKLPKGDNTPIIIQDELALQYYRISKIEEGDINLIPGIEGALKGPIDVGTAEKRDKMLPLSELVDVLNDRLGTEFTKADQLFFDQIEEDIIADEKLSLQAKNNTIDNYKYGLEDVFFQKVLERMDTNQEICERILSDDKFSTHVKEFFLRKTYDRFRDNQV
jgi:type I restriction enzyme R subunit